MGDRSLDVDARHDTELGPGVDEKPRDCREASPKRLRADIDRRKVANEEQVERSPRIPEHGIPGRGAKLGDLEVDTRQLSSQYFEVDAILRFKIKIVDRVKCGEPILDLSSASAKVGRREIGQACVESVVAEPGRGDRLPRQQFVDDGCSEGAKLVGG